MDVDLGDTAQAPTGATSVRHHPGCTHSGGRGACTMARPPGCGVFCPHRLPRWHDYGSCVSSGGFSERPRGFRVTRWLSGRRSPRETQETTFGCKGSRRGTQLGDAPQSLPADSVHVGVRGLLLRFRAACAGKRRPSDSTDARPVPRAEIRAPGKPRRCPRHVAKVGVRTEARGFGCDWLSVCPLPPR